MRNWIKQNIFGLLSERQQRAYRAARLSIKLLLIMPRLALDGMRIERNNDAITVSKGGRQVIFKEYLISGNFDELFNCTFAVISNFDRFFGNRIIENDGKTMDFTRANVVNGHEVLTDPGGFLEIEPVIFGYNKQYEIKEGDIVIDGGAYYGMFTMLASGAVGKTGHVYAFEPDDRTSTVLANNIKANNMGNVTVVNAGLWSKTDRLDFDAQHTESSHIVEDGVMGKTQTVDVTSIADFCKKNRIVPNFVKMDVEGAEQEAIRGSLDFIKRHDIHFAIASYHNKGGAEDLERMFESIGYEANTGNPVHQTTYARKRGWSTQGGTD